VPSSLNRLRREDVEEPPERHGQLRDDNFWMSTGGGSIGMNDHSRGGGRVGESSGAARKDLGNLGESLAAEWLIEKGHQIIGQQVRCSLGEIDLITRDGKRLVFVEVKTRLSIHHGTPEEAVTPAKQRRLTQLALSYLKEHGLLDQSARFDVVAYVLNESLEVQYRRHYEHAFEASTHSSGMY